MAEDITTDDAKEPRKFKDRKEYLEFIAEQKALKDKENKNSTEDRFELFDKDSHLSKKEKRPKEQIDTLRSILTAVNNNNKLSNQILAKLNQKVVKESLSEDVDKFKKLQDKFDELKSNVSDLRRTAESIRLAVLDRQNINEQQLSTPIDIRQNARQESTTKVIEKSPQYITNIRQYQNINEKQLLTPIDIRQNARQESTTKVIEKYPQYITNIRQYQYKRNPNIKTSRRESVVSGLGRKIGTHIGGRGLGSLIAKSIRIGEKTTGAIIKAPFKVADKVVKGVTGNNSRNALIRANRTAETSKFRKKMLDLLGIISKKDTQSTSTTQTSSSNGLSNLLKIGGAAALAGGIASQIPAIKERFTKNEDGTFGPEHKGGAERVKQLASGMAESSVKIMSAFGQGVKEAADKQLLEFGENNYKRFKEIESTVNDYSKSILDALSNALNGVYDKLSNVASNVADKALEISTDIYNAPGKAVDYVSDMVKNSPPGKALQRDINEIVANNPFPDYVSGMKDSNKFTPNKDYNNIANSLNKPSTSPTLRQLEVQQKQADNLQRDRDKSSSQPVIINNSTNTKETPKQQPSIVRLGTRNLDSSNQQLQRSILSGGYIGTGFLVQ